MGRGEERTPTKHLMKLSVRSCRMDLLDDEEARPPPPEWEAGVGPRAELHH